MKGLSQDLILGNPFLHQIKTMERIDSNGILTTLQGNKILFKFITKPRSSKINELKRELVFKENQINFIKEEIKVCNLQTSLENPLIKGKIKALENRMREEICSEIPSAFCERKKHVVRLPYENDFNEKDIPTKARPIQMNKEMVDFCKREIQGLLEKNLIRKSKSPWSCSTFYVNKNSEKERGVLRLVINYKPLNKVLKWIRYPIPNKKDLLSHLDEAFILSKFDLKSGYWQIQIHEEDRYETAFVVPFGQY